MELRCFFAFFSVLYKTHVIFAVYQINVNDLYCIVLYCIVLYCIVLYCIVLYCICTVRIVYKCYVYVENPSSALNSLFEQSI